MQFSDEIKMSNSNSDFSSSSEDEQDYNCLFHDYGQKVNGRQFFKYDFMPDLTKTLTRGYYDN